MNINSEALASVGLLGNIYTPDSLKKAYIKDWQKNPTNINYCLEEINKGRATGYAVVTGNDGLIALDFDGKNANRIAIEALPWVMDIATLTWSSGKPNRKGKMFRIPEDRRQEFAHITKRSIRSYANIKELPSESLEISYKRSKVTLPPSAHPETDGYKWVNFVPIHKLTDNQCDSLLELLRTSYDNHEPKKQYTLTDKNNREQEIALEALDYINPDLEYEGWIKVGTALKNMSFDFSVWDSWSSKGEKYAKTNHREMERKWESFSNTRLGIQTILHYAEGYKQTQSKIYTLTDKPVIKSRIKTNKNKVDKKSKNDKPLAYTFDEFMDFCGSENTEYLVDTFLPKGEMIILHGASGTGKTRLALDLAYAMLTNGTFLGESVKQGKILLITSDQGKKATKRTLQLRGFDLLDNRNNFLVRRDFQIKQLDLLRQLLNEFKPDLVILDSLTSITSTTAIDENKSEIAKAVIPIRELLDEYNASSILIHHDNKNVFAKGTDKMAGSSRLVSVAHSVWSLVGIDENADKTLTIKSREDAGSKHTLHFNDEDNWVEKGFLNYIGEIGFSNQDKSQSQQLIDLLVHHSDGLSSKEIASFLPNIKSLKKVLNRVTNTGKIEARRDSRVPKGFIYFVSNSKNKNSHTTVDTLVDNNSKSTLVNQVVNQPNTSTSIASSSLVDKNIIIRLTKEKSKVDTEVENNSIIHNIVNQNSKTIDNKEIKKVDTLVDTKLTVNQNNTECNNNGKEQKTEFIEIDWKESLKELEILLNKKKLISKKSRLMFVRNYFDDKFIKSVYHLTNEQVLSLLTYLRIEE